MMDAIQRAGDTNAAHIRAAIAGTRNFEAATGRITIDPQRNAVKGAVILEVRENSFRFRQAVDPP